MRVRRRYFVIPILLLVLGAVVVRSNTMIQSTSQQVQGQSAPPSPYCRSGDPLAGVANDPRFRVVSNCEVASGTVESVTLRESGGQGFYVRLDAQYAHLLGSRNSNYQNALLLVETAPLVQVMIPVLSVGQHITFVGPLVYDTYDQWNAIYPVWSIQSN